MKLHDIGPTPGSKKTRHRVGRGDSSGWGKTAGRGEKGQKSRSGAKIRPFFEGGQIPLFRRLPKRGFKNADRIIYQIVNLSQLEAAFNAGDVADETTMREKKLLAKGECVIKVLANGDISKSITVKAAKFSEAAKAKIEAAGGSVEIIG
jgi:large subunit ribosomal protein L15